MYSSISTDTLHTDDILRDMLTVDFRLLLQTQFFNNRRMVSYV